MQIDSAFADFFAEMREQQTAERVLCLYGAVRHDTAFVNFIKPANMRTRTATRASYDECPVPKYPGLIANYLGTWHAHNLPWVTWDDLCRFSPTDDDSFEGDKEGVIELLSCKGRLMARSKLK